MMNMIIADRASYGLITATAGTIIQRFIRPFKGAKSVVTGFRYTCGTTAHVLTARMSIGTTTLSQPAAAGQTVITLAGQPTAARAIATNDFIVVERVETQSGRNYFTWELYKVSTAVQNVDGSVTVTLTANVAGVHAVAQKVWLMSLDTDTIPGYDTTNPKFNLPLSTVTELPSNALAASGGLVGTWGIYEPMILESNNLTAAGTIEYATAVGFVPASGRKQ